MRFERCAHTYDEHAAPQRAFAARVMEFIGNRPGEDTLELGAGTGALTAHLCRQAGTRVQASDASPAMVRLGRAAVPAAEWSELDAFRAPPPTARLQVSSGLLQWAQDPVEVLQRWAAALAPGGRMVHAMACEPCLCEWRALVPESPIAWRDEAAWRTIFHQAGLRVTRSQLWIEQPHFPSALDLVRAWHASGVTGRVHHGPGRLRRAMREYDAQHQSAEGVVSTWAWLAIEAHL